MIKNSSEQNITFKQALRIDYVRNTKFSEKLNISEYDKLYPSYEREFLIRKGEQKIYTQEHINIPENEKIEPKFITEHELQSKHLRNSIAALNTEIDERFIKNESAIIKVVGGSKNMEKIYKGWVDTIGNTVEISTVTGKFLNGQISKEEFNVWRREKALNQKQTHLNPIVLMTKNDLSNDEQQFKNFIESTKTQQDLSKYLASNNQDEKLIWDVNTNKAEIENKFFNVLSVSKNIMFSVIYKFINLIKIKSKHSK